MTAHELLDRLDQTGMVDPAVTAALRRKVSQPGKSLSARKVVSFLVSKGHLTDQQAKRLLSEQTQVRELTEADLVGEAETSSSSARSKSKSRKRRHAQGTAKQGDDDLLMLGEADVVDDPEEEVVDLIAAEEPAGAAPPSLDDLGEFGGNSPFGEDGEDWSQMRETHQKKKETPKFAGKKVVDNQWDSKWILIGPTIIAILGLATFFLWFLLGRGDATQLYEAFDESYKQQRYIEAIELGEKFVSRFPRNEYADTVQVFRGMARIRIPVEGRDWEDSLEQLQTTLPEIKEFEAFADARDDVPFLILTVAEGFAQQAEAAAEEDIETAQALVNQADATMELAGNSEYIPSSQRTKPVNEAFILRINETISRTKRAIATENELLTALKEIDEAIEQGATERAFETRKALLRPYPQLESDPRLQDAVLRISQQERELVEVEATDLRPVADEPSSPVVGTHLVSTQTGDTIPTLDGEVYPLLVNGTVYAVNVGTGKILWRRHVDVATTYQPRWIDRELKEDLLLVNSGRQELLRVRAADGEVQWRTPIGQAFAEPVIANQRAYLATTQGRLLEVDLANGEATRGSQIPQPLDCGPATGSRSKVLFQPGRHSNLYVLSTSNLECQEVYYMGHAAGSIAVAPELASGYLFVAENFPAGAATDPYTDVHVLLPQPDGIVPVQTPIRLRGNVVTPMLLYQRKLLVITNLGDIVLLDVDVTSESRPVASVASFTLKTNPGLTDYYAAADGRLFVADLGLTGFTIQAQRGKLDRQTATNAGDVFVAPLAIFGDHLVHARIRRSSSLVSISAVRVDDAAEVWRADLAAPLAGDPLVREESKQVVALNAQGDQFAFAFDQLTGFSNQKPAARGSTARQDLVFEHLATLSQNRALAVGPGQPIERDGQTARQLQCLALDPARATLSSRIFSHPMLYEQLMSEPVTFGEGVLLPSSGGQVFWLDPSTGRDRATPFQPAIEPGVSIGWTRPAPLNEQTFAVADQKGVLYRVRRQTGTQETLVKAAERRYEHPFVTPLAAIEQQVFVGCETPDGQTLVSFAGEEFDEVNTTELPGRVVAGPVARSGLLLMILDDGKLHAFDRQLTPQWELASEGQVWAGAPLATETHLWFAMNRGTVLQVDASSGEVTGSWEVGEPIASGVVPVDGKLTVGALDGTLLVLEP